MTSPYMPTLERLKAVEGLGFATHAPRHIISCVCYNKISSIMNAYYRVCFTIKAEKTFPGLLLKTRKIY